MPKVSGHGYAFQGYASSNFSENKEKWDSILMEKLKRETYLLLIKLSILCFYAILEDW